MVSVVVLCMIALQSTNKPDQHAQVRLTLRYTQEEEEEVQRGRNFALVQARHSSQGYLILFFFLRRKHSRKIIQSQFFPPWGNSWRSVAAMLQSNIPFVEILYYIFYTFPYKKLHILGSFFPFFMTFPIRRNDDGEQQLHYTDYSSAMFSRKISSLVCFFPVRFFFVDFLEVLHINKHWTVNAF